jgi:hypothetical protein
LEKEMDTSVLSSDEDTIGKYVIRQRKKQEICLVNQQPIKILVQKQLLQSIKLKERKQSLGR